MLLSHHPTTPPSPGAAPLTLMGVASEGDTLRAAFSGEIDLSNASWFADAVAELLRVWPHRRLCVDLGGVRLLDSSGVQALVVSWRRAASQCRDLVVADPQPIVRRVLQITGVFDLLTLAGAADVPAAPSGRHG